MKTMKCPKCKGLGGYPKCGTCQNKLVVNEEADDRLPLTPCSRSSDTPDSARIIENIDIAMRADTREQSLAHLEEAHREIENMESEKARLSALYHELLLSVESVHDGESRHQTALRYIRERETFSCAPASDSSENAEVSHRDRERQPDAKQLSDQP